MTTTGKQQILRQAEIAIDKGASHRCDIQEAAVQSWKLLRGLSATAPLLPYDNRGATKCTFKISHTRTPNTSSFQLTVSGVADSMQILREVMFVPHSVVGIPRSSRVDHISDSTVVWPVDILSLDPFSQSRQCLSFLSNGDALLRLRIGNTHKLIPFAESKKIRNPPAMRQRHSWKMFVEAEDGGDLGPMVRYVEFIPEPFSHSTRRTRAPFDFNGKSWGSFDIKVKIVFSRVILNAPVEIVHHLFLSGEGHSEVFEIELKSVKESDLRTVKVHLMPESSVIGSDPENHVISYTMDGDEGSYEHTLLVEEPAKAASVRAKTFKRDVAYSLHTAQSSLLSLPDDLMNEILLQVIDQALNLRLVCKQFYLATMGIFAKDNSRATSGNLIRVKKLADAYVELIDDDRVEALCCITHGAKSHTELARKFTQTHAAIGTPINFFHVGGGDGVDLVSMSTFTNGVVYNDLGDPEPESTEGVGAAGKHHGDGDVETKEGSGGKADPHLTFVNHLRRSVARRVTICVEEPAKMVLGPSIFSKVPNVSRFRLGNISLDEPETRIIVEFPLPTRHEMVEADRAEGDDTTIIVKAWLEIEKSDNEIERFGDIQRNLVWAYADEPDEDVQEEIAMHKYRLEIASQLVNVLNSGPVPNRVSAMIKAQEFPCPRPDSLMAKSIQDWLHYGLEILSHQHEVNARCLSRLASVFGTYRSPSVNLRIDVPRVIPALDAEKSDGETVTEKSAIDLSKLPPLPPSLPTSPPPTSPSPRTLSRGTRSSASKRNSFTMISGDGGTSEEEEEEDDDAEGDGEEGEEHEEEGDGDGGPRVEAMMTLGETEPDPVEVRYGFDRDGNRIEL